MVKQVVFPEKKNKIKFRTEWHHRRWRQRQYRRKTLASALIYLRRSLLSPSLSTTPSSPLTAHPASPSSPLLRRTLSTAPPLAPSSTIPPPSLLRTYPRFSQPPTFEQLSVSSTPSPPPPPPPLCRTGSAAFSPTTAASWPILPSPSLSDAPPVSSPPF